MKSDRAEQAGGERSSRLRPGACQCQWFFFISDPLERRSAAPAPRGGGDAG